MDKVMVEHIVDKVEELSATEGVRVYRRDYTSPTMNKEEWRVILEYEGYSHEQDFNSSLNIDYKYIDDVALALLTNLFAQYFESKLERTIH